MTKTTRDEARFLNQCSNGYRTRLCAFAPLVVALDRTTIGDGVSHVLADAIVNETRQKFVTVIPCNAKIVRVFANAITWVTQAAGGTTTVTLYKTVSGADTALNTALAVGGETPPTDETVQDATLSVTAGALDVVEGAVIYAQVAVSNHAVSACSDGMVVGIEYYPTEA